MIKLQRTGQRPLAFEGEQIAAASSRHHAGKERNRWHEISVYRAASGKHAVSIEYRTQWEGEATHSDSLVFDTLDEVGILLENYIMPNLASIGYPARPDYAERQAKLISDLTEGFQHAASEVLDTLDCSEKI